MYQLGRTVHHDPRSKDFDFLRVATFDPVRTVLWDHQAPVLDQGRLGSCTGNAMTQLLNCEVYASQREDHDYLTEETAVRLYSIATTLDPFQGTYPPEDTGSNGLSVAKAARSLGYVSRYYWAFKFSTLLRALMRGPVITGTTWHDGMFQPDNNGFLHPTGGIAGGHEYLILGANMEYQYLTILNSWSSSWGENGRAKLSFKDYQYLMSEQGDITIPVVVA